jgi:hypothetical protein
MIWLKNNLQNCFRIFFSDFLLSRLDSLWIFDMRRHSTVIMLYAEFIVKMSNMDDMVN